MEKKHEHSKVYEVNDILTQYLFYSQFNKI